MQRKLRPWVKVAIAILVIAILVGAVNLIVNTTAPCKVCREPCSASESERSAVDGRSAICDDCMENLR